MHLKKDVQKSPYFFILKSQLFYTTTMLNPQLGKKQQAYPDQD
jgi:hypothetical protein